jgi:hypothetical protein
MSVLTTSTWRDFSEQRIAFIFKVETIRARERSVRRLVMSVLTTSTWRDVSEQHVASIFRVEKIRAREKR